MHGEIEVLGFLPLMEKLEWALHELQLSCDDLDHLLGPYDLDLSGWKPLKIALFLCSTPIAILAQGHGSDG